MNREVIDRWCERGILGLVMAILVYAPLATGAVRSLEFLIVQGLTIAVMMLWAARLWISPKPQLLWPPLCWVILAFAVYAVVRYLTADIEYVARKEMIKVLVYTFLFLAILNNLHRQEYTQAISFTLIFLAMGISCYAVYQFITGSDRVWHFITPFKGRGGGTYICPNHLAGFLEMLLPLALSYTLLGRGPIVRKIVLAYAGLVMLAGLAATVSRGGWLCCSAALLVLFCIMLTQRGRRLPALVLLVVLLGTATVFVIRTKPLETRFQYQSSPEVTTENVRDSSLRLVLWGSAIKMWRDHLWFGAGPAHFDYLFGIYRPVYIQGKPERVHNDYLNVLVDWGIVGGVLVTMGIGGLVLGVLKSWRHVRRSETEFRSGLSNKFGFVVGASVGLLAMCLHSALDFNMHIPANALVAVALAALLISHLRFATERFWTSAQLWKRVALSTILLGGIGYLGWQEVRLGGEYVWTQKASGKPLYSSAQLALLEKAFLIESNNPQLTYKIGECNRMPSFQGVEGEQKMAQTALQWYERGMKLNPYDPYNHLHYGLCLSWLGKPEEAPPYINKADELDPNSYDMARQIGRYYAEAGDYAAARTWLMRSKRLKPDNEFADSWLVIVDRRLREKAAGHIGSFVK